MACAAIEALCRQLAAKPGPDWLRVVCLRSARSPDTLGLAEAGAASLLSSGISAEEWQTKMAVTHATQAATHAGRGCRRRHTPGLRLRHHDDRRGRRPPRTRVRITTAASCKLSNAAEIRCQTSDAQDCLAATERGAARRTSELDVGPDGAGRWTPERPG